MHAEEVGRLAEVAVGLGQHVRNEAFLELALRIVISDAAGHHVVDQALDVKNGDTILFGKYSGQEIKIDGEDYLIMREDEVLAVFDSKGK